MNRACASTHVVLFQCKFPLIIMLHQVPVDPIQHHYLIYTLILRKLYWWGNAGVCQLSRTPYVVR